MYTVTITGYTVSIISGNHNEETEEYTVTSRFSPVHNVYIMSKVTHSEFPWDDKERAKSFYQNVSRFPRSDLGNY